MEQIGTKVTHKEKIMKFLKEPLLYLLILIIFIQVVIYSSIPNSSVQYDSTSYLYNYNKGSIFKGYVDDVRTPVYPYFIKLIKKIGGEANLNNNISYVQKILFLISIILMYYTLKMLVKNKIVVSALTVIFGICPTIITWNIFVLTESIAMLEMSILAFITVKYLKNPSKITAGLMGIVILSMILTRPAFIYLLPIYILFIILRWFLYKEERKKLLFVMVSMLICCIVLVGYCFQIKRYYGVFGLTSVSSLNNLVSAIYCGAYKEGNNSGIITEIDNLVGEQVPSQERAFEIYREIEKNHTQTELSNFANSALKNNDKYKNFIINKFISLGTRNIGTSYIQITDSNGNIILNYGDLGTLFLPITFGLIYILLIVSGVYLIWYLIKYKKINWFCAFFTSMIFANLFTLIIGAPFEEQRLFFPTVFLVIAYLGMILGRIFDFKELSIEKR